MSKPKASDQDATSAGETTYTGGTTAYPKYSLDDALTIPQAIEDSYSGKPMPPKSLAEACGASHGSGTWRTKLAAARAYGLIEGSYGANEVALTERAVAILRPKSVEERARALREAVRAPELFGKVYQHFDTGKFPEGEFFHNLLTREFGVPKDDVDRFQIILQANANYAYPGEASGAPLGHDEAEVPEETADAVSVQGQPQTAEVVSVEELAASPPPRSPRVFVGHSKNEGILHIIRKTMAIADFKYEIAEEEETTALPVPEKVFDAMRGCTAGVINVSADEEDKDDDGTYRINQNVLIEIGAAFVLYDRDVVLVWDKRLPVPSNLQGLYRCDYEGDTLAAEDLLKLQEAIAKFRTPASEE